MERIVSRKTLFEIGLVYAGTFIAACARKESPKPEYDLDLGGDNEKGFGQFTIVFPKDYFSKRRRYSFIFENDGRQVDTTIYFDSTTVIEETLKKMTKGSIVLQDQLEFAISNLNPREQHTLTSDFDEWEGFRKNWKFKSVILDNETVWLPNT